MKKISCEMCGSTDIIKEDGVFVCQNCGVKYSLEEAKKMMTVKVDNSESIDNYLSMAKNAYGADNKEESESYCNRILEIDNKNYEAWLLKGKSAGWQSSIERLRIEEAINCFSNAIDNTPEEGIEKTKSEVVKEILNLASELIAMYCENFSEYLNSNTANDIIDVAERTKRGSERLLLKCGENTKDLSLILSRRIANTAVSVYKNKIYYKYSNDPKPMELSWRPFVVGADAVITLVETAITLANGYELSETIALYYSSLINIQKDIINSVCWVINEKLNFVECRLSSNSQQIRKDEMMEWHRKWNEIDSTHVIPTEI